MFWVKVYQDEILASVRVLVTRVEARGHSLQLFHEESFIGSVYFETKSDCHHIEIGE